MLVLKVLSGDAKFDRDHMPGMKVPKGGSNCAKCEYLKDAEKKICGEPNFVAWNKSEVIPGEIDSYCSDWFEEKKKAGGIAGALARSRK